MVFVQPYVLVPVTENVRVKVKGGLTVRVTTAEPLEKTYVFAPVGTMVNDWPEQTDPLLTATVGTGFTVTVTGVRLALTPQVVVVCA